MCVFVCVCVCVCVWIVCGHLLQLSGKHTRTHHPSPPHGGQGCRESERQRERREHQGTPSADGSTLHAATSPPPCPLPAQLPWPLPWR